MDANFYEIFQTFKKCQALSRKEGFYRLLTITIPSYNYKQPVFAEKNGVVLLSFAPEISHKLQTPLLTTESTPLRSTSTLLKINF